MGFPGEISRNPQQNQKKELLFQKKSTPKWVASGVRVEGTGVGKESQKRSQESGPGVSRNLTAEPQRALS